MAPILLATLAIMLGGFALGLHVATTIGVTALATGWLFSPRPLWDVLSYIPWNVETTSSLVALPLFILMGELLLRIGVTDQMYGSLAKWTSRLPGSLIHTNVVSSALFACISGSSSATAATIGGVAVPYMRARGYDNRLTLGSVAAGGTLGILIPPSIVMIVYGVLAEASIGQLYMAGIVPGLLMTAAFMAVIFVAARLDPAKAPREAATTWGDRVRSILGLVPVIALIIAVLGTIYLGIATATEAAAFGVTGAAILAVLYRRCSWQVLRASFLATATTTGMIMFILVAAFVLQFVVSFLGIPAALTRAVVAMNLSATQMVLLICGLYLILGMFMESLSMVVITIPILLPVLKALGIDMVWFGVLVVIMVEIALITPPVGMNLFILQALSRNLDGGRGGRSSDVIVGILPFLGAMLLVLALIVMFPDIAMWLVRQAKG
jgi:tripartite ATP-independent transporter DctM subunit